MANRRPSDSPSGARPRSRKAATSPEARESQMISLAEKLAEQQLQEGTASAQVITHYLKLSSSREQLEQERIRGEVELQKAKIDAMASTQRLEAMYTKAMDAFRGYQGRGPENPDEDQDDV